MDWAAAGRSLSDDSFTVAVTIGWTVTLAGLACALGIALGYAIGWAIWARRFRDQFEGMRKTMLEFADENKQLKLQMDGRDIDVALSQVKGEGGD